MQPPGYQSGDRSFYEMGDAHEGEAELPVGMRRRRALDPETDPDKWGWVFTGQGEERKASSVQKGKEAGISSLCRCKDHCKYFDRSGAVGAGDWEEVVRLKGFTVAQPWSPLRVVLRGLNTSYWGGCTGRVMADNGLGTFVILKNIKVKSWLSGRKKLTEYHIESTFENWGIRIDGNIIFTITVLELFLRWLSSPRHQPKQVTYTASTNPHILTFWGKC